MKRVKFAVLAKNAKKLGPSDIHFWHFDFGVPGIKCMLLCSYAPMLLCRICFAVGRFGKPALTTSGNPFRPRFNLSHSGQRIAIALCHHANSGVDIEKIRKGAKPQTLANRYFAPEEQLLLAACN